MYKIPPMVGGVKYEHGHRMMAQVVGLLTMLLAGGMQWGGNRKATKMLLALAGALALIGAAVYFFVGTVSKIGLNGVRTSVILALGMLVLSASTFLPFRDPRAWMRKIGWTALFLVILQGLLGGLTVLLYTPWWVSTFHAAVAQTFFALTVLFVFFAGREWIESDTAQSATDIALGVRTLSMYAIVALYMQLLFGAGFRHGGMHFLPHLVGAIFASAVLLWTSIRTLMSFARVRQVAYPAVTILALMTAQLGLGFAAYLTRVEWGRDAAQPYESLIITTVSHVATGALLLATAFVLAVQSRRVLAAQTDASPEFTRSGKAVVA
jgi:cytochrome c oxidase assembly protein subunit 15